MDFPWHHMHMECNHHCGITEMEENNSNLCDTFKTFAKAALSVCVCVCVLGGGYLQSHSFVPSMLPD